MVVSRIMRVLLAAMFFVLGVNATYATPKRPGHVYLFRGFANVFSTGMDTLASELVARGYDAEVYSHLSADSAAAEAAKLQKSGKGPIIIMGHSLGGPAAISMAKRMQELGANVALIVTFGPNVSDPVPSNVARAINFYQSLSIVNSTLRKGPGFKGTISNINMDSAAGITHFNIDKIESLHRQAIAAVASATAQVVPPNPTAAAHVERRTEVYR
jgi:pimeloyl-ACP methyl ester carboxylesterase